MTFQKKNTKFLISISGCYIIVKYSHMYMHVFSLETLQKSICIIWSSVIHNSQRYSVHAENHKEKDCCLDTMILLIISDILLLVTKPLQCKLMAISAPWLLLALLPLSRDCAAASLCFCSNSAFTFAFFFFSWIFFNLSSHHKAKRVP